MMYHQGRVSPEITQTISTCFLYLAGKHTFVPMTEAINNDEKRWEEEMESTRLAPGVSSADKHTVKSNGRGSHQ